MKRVLVWTVAFVSLGIVFAAQGEPPITVGAAHPAARSRTALDTQLRLAEPAERALCVVQPARWRDASDALVWATHPTARLDAQERASAGLAPLVDLRLDSSALRLFVLGTPTARGLALRHALDGWRRRSPDC